MSAALFLKTTLSELLSRKYMLQIPLCPPPSPCGCCGRKKRSAAQPISVDLTASNATTQCNSIHLKNIITKVTLTFSIFFQKIFLEALLRNPKQIRMFASSKHPQRGNSLEEIKITTQKHILITVFRLQGNVSVFKKRKSLRLRIAISQQQIQLCNI